MSDLADILASKKLPQEPSEFKTIRTFVQERFDVTPGLKIHDNSIIISVPGSAAAGSLRFKLPELESLLDTDRQLVITSV